MKRALVICISIVLLFSLTGCEEYRQQMKEDVTEKLLENLLGDGAQVDIIYPSMTNENNPQATPSNTESSTSSNKQDWPEDIPSEVPKVSSNIENVLKTPKGVILDFGEVEMDIVQTYNDELILYQYEKVREEISNKLVDATYEKGENTVKIYWYEGGSFTLMITWK
ncbi:MAG: hypothetical protein KAQ68_03390 [Clostridiales bacterium]|nr:hypothetical protein [Clostridiales bacterium]